MVSFGDLLVLIGMFALRFGVPLLIMLGLAYLLKRLDRRWEAEAWAQPQVTEQVEQPEVRRPVERPATTKRAPAPALPFVPQPAMAKDTRPGIQPGLAAFQPGQRCYDLHDCSESQRSQCGAVQHPGVPCWQARSEAEGHMPEECAGCEMFHLYPTM